MSVFSARHDTGDIEEGKSRQYSSIANDERRRSRDIETPHERRRSRDIESAQKVSVHKVSVSTVFTRIARQSKPYN